MTIIEILDYSRLNLFIEDGGYRGSYVHVKTIEDFVIIAIQSAPYFFTIGSGVNGLDRFEIFLCSFINIP